MCAIDLGRSTNQSFLGCWVWALHIINAMCTAGILILNICYLYFRPILQQYGMWDQVRVDKGNEWVLLLFVQEWLSQFRTNTRKYPHIRSTSKQVWCLSDGDKVIFYVFKGYFLAFPSSFCLLPMYSGHIFALNLLQLHGLCALLDPIVHYSFK